MKAPEEINAEASNWMKRGIALLTENTPESLTNSLPCFERAISLRRTLPLEENPWYRYVLAAGFMNRADAFTRLGSVDEAVREYDAAIAILQTLDLEENRVFRKRAAIAWMNRGVALQPRNLPAAVMSFESAIAISPDASLLATSLANLGNALLQLSPPKLLNARDAFEKALRLLSHQEETDLDAAEVCVRARHGICRAVAWQLTDESNDELVSAATDAMEDALRLARHWQSRGETRFDELALELIQFGVHAYRKYQPHFVAEFLAEMLAAFQNPALCADQLRNCAPA